MTGIKICGLKRKVDIEYVNEVSPDCIGFVFYEKSKRYVTRDEAKELSDILDKSIKRVGVYVNESIDVIVSDIQKNIIDVVQLHGAESDDYIVRLKQKAGETTIIKAFNIKSFKDIESANKSSADIVLLDHGAGGTGVAFDWSMILGMKRQYILAGGLGLCNIKDALDSLNPFMVDVSSGVESDGFKDKDKIKKFCETVRRK